MVKIMIRIMMITGRASALVMVVFETISKRGFTTHHSVIQGQTKLGSHEKFFFSPGDGKAWERLLSTTSLTSTTC